MIEVKQHHVEKKDVLKKDMFPECIPNSLRKRNGNNTESNDNKHFDIFYRNKSINDEISQPPSNVYPIPKPLSIGNQGLLSIKKCR